MQTWETRGKAGEGVKGGKGGQTERQGRQDDREQHVHDSAQVHIYKYYYSTRASKT
jgi:hypothetical protein